MEVAELPYDALPPAAQRAFAERCHWVPSRLYLPEVGFAVLRRRRRGVTAADAEPPLIAFALFPTAFCDENDEFPDAAMVADAEVLGVTSPRDRLDAARSIIASYRRRPGVRGYRIACFSAPAAQALFGCAPDSPLARLPGAIMIPGGEERGSVAFPADHGLRLRARERGVRHTAFIRLRIEREIGNRKSGFAVAPSRPEGDEVVQLPWMGDDMLLATRRVWLQEARGVMTVHFETPITYLTSANPPDVHLGFSLDGEPFRYPRFRMNKLACLKSVGLAPGASGFTTHTLVDNAYVFQMTGFRLDVRKAETGEDEIAYGLDKFLSFLRCAPERKERRLRLEAANAIKRAWRRWASDPNTKLGQIVQRKRFEALGGI
jgi:hypothetical protein